MIIVSDKNIQNSIYFPKNIYNESSDIYKLVLENRGTNEKYEFDVEDTLEATYGFYTFNTDFSNLPNGEYEYTISGNGEKTIPDTDYEITYGKFFDTFTERILPTNYLDIYRYVLEEDYNEYDFFVTAKVNRVDGVPFLANYFDEANNFIGKEYRLPGTFESVQITIPEGTKEIIFSHPIPLTILDTFKVLMKRKKGPTLYSKGLIRINELKENNVKYNDNRTYIAYDKQ
jgi:hypothetical protein